MEQLGRTRDLRLPQQRVPGSRDFELVNQFRFVTRLLRHVPFGFLFRRKVVESETWPCRHQRGFFDDGRNRFTSDRRASITC